MRVGPPPPPTHQTHVPDRYATTEGPLPLPRSIYFRPPASHIHVIILFIFIFSPFLVLARAVGRLICRSVGSEASVVRSSSSKRRAQGPGREVRESVQGYHQLGALASGCGSGEIVCFNVNQPKLLIKWALYNLSSSWFVTELQVDELG